MTEDTTPTPSAEPDTATDLAWPWTGLQHLFDPWPGSLPLFGTKGPRADVEEMDDAYLVEIELPGVAKHDVEVQQAGRRLIVTGERNERERVGVLRHRTRVLGKFRYELVLPTEVRDDGVDAALAEGVLTIRVPKRDTDHPHHVPIA